MAVSIAQLQAVIEADDTQLRETLERDDELLRQFAQQVIAPFKLLLDDSGIREQLVTTVETLQQAVAEPFVAHIVLQDSAAREDVLTLSEAIQALTERPTVLVVQANVRDAVGGLLAVQERLTEIATTETAARLLLDDRAFQERLAFDREALLTLTAEPFIAHVSLADAGALDALGVLRAELQGIAEQPFVATVQANIRSLTASLAVARQRLAEIGETAISPRLFLDTTPFERSLLAATTALRQFDSQVAVVQLQAEAAGLNATAEGAFASLRSQIASVRTEIAVDPAQLERSLSSAFARLREAAGEVVRVPLDLDVSRFDERLAAVREQLETFRRSRPTVRLAIDDREVTERVSRAQEMVLRFEAMEPAPVALFANETGIVEALERGGELLFSWRNRQASARLDATTAAVVTAIERAQELIRAFSATEGIAHLFADDTAFRRTLAEAAGQLRSFSSQSATALIALDVAGAQAGAERMLATFREIAASPASASLTFDPTQFTERVEAVRGNLNAFAEMPVSIKLVLDDTRLKEALAEDDRLLRELHRTTYSPKVTLDETQFRERLIEIEQALTRLGQKGIAVPVTAAAPPAPTPPQVASGEFIPGQTGERLIPQEPIVPFDRPGGPRAFQAAERGLYYNLPEPPPPPAVTARVPIPDAIKVPITAEDVQLRTTIREAATKLAEFSRQRAQVALTAESRQLQEEIGLNAERLAGFARSVKPLKIGAEGEQARRTLSDLAVQLDTLIKKQSTIGLGWEDRGSDEGINRARAALQRLTGQLWKAVLGLGDEELNRKFGLDNTLLQEAEAQRHQLNLGLNDAELQRKVPADVDRIAAETARSHNFNVGVNDAAVDASMQKAQENAAEAERAIRRAHLAAFDTPPPQLDANIAPVQEKTATARQLVMDFEGTVATAREDVDISAVRQKVSESNELLGSVERRRVEVPITTSLQELAAELDKGKRITQALDDIYERHHPTIKINTDISDVAPKVEQVEEILQAETSKIHTTHLGLDFTDAVNELVRKGVDFETAAKQVLARPLQAAAAQGKASIDEMVAQGEARLSEMAGRPATIKFEGNDSQLKGVEKQVLAGIQAVDGRRVTVTYAAQTWGPTPFPWGTPPLPPGVQGPTLPSLFPQGTTPLPPGVAGPTLPPLPPLPPSAYAARATLFPPPPPMPGAPPPGGPPPPPTAPKTDRIYGLLGLGFAVQALTAPLEGLGRQVLEADEKMDALARAMTHVMGSSRLAQDELVKLREVAKLPGLGFEEAVEGSVRLQSAGASAAMARTAMLQFGNAIALAGGGKKELEGVTLALTKMFATGTVQGRELRQILIRVPELGKIIKEQFNIDKAVDFGKAGVSVETFVGRVTKALGQLPRFTDSVKNDFENLQDSVTVSFWKMAQGTEPVVRDLARKAGAALEGFAEHFRMLSPETQSFIFAMGGIGVAAGKAVIPLTAAAFALQMLVGAVGGVATVALLAGGLAITALGAAYVSNLGGIRDAVNSLFKPAHEEMMLVSRASADEVTANVSKINGLTLKEPEDHFTPKMEELTAKTKDWLTAQEDAMTKVGKLHLPVPDIRSPFEKFREGFAAPFVEGTLATLKIWTKFLDSTIESVHTWSINLGARVGGAIHDAFANAFRRMAGTLPAPPNPHNPQPGARVTVSGEVAYQPLSEREMAALARSGFMPGAIEAGKEAATASQLHNLEKLNRAWDEHRATVEKASTAADEAARIAAENIQKAFRKAIDTGLEKLAELMAAGNKLKSLEIKFPDFSPEMIAQLAAIDTAIQSWEKLRRIQDEISRSVEGLMRHYVELGDAILHAFDYAGKRPKATADIGRLAERELAAEREVLTTTRAAVGPTGYIQIPAGPVTSGREQFGIPKSPGAYTGAAEGPEAGGPPALPDVRGMTWQKVIPPAAVPIVSGAAPAPFVQFSTNASQAMAATLGQNIVLDPGVRASCANFVRKHLEAAGVAVTKTNFADDLIKDLLRRGEAQRIPTSAMRAGDIVEFTGTKYGTQRPVGHHVAIAASERTIIDSSGGAIRPEHAMRDAAHAQVFRLTGSSVAQTISMTSAQAALRASHKKTNDEAARGLDIARKTAGRELIAKQVQDMEQLATQIALAGAKTEEQRVAIGLLGQTYENVSPRVQALIDRHKQLDAIYLLTGQRHEGERIAIEAEGRAIKALTEADRESDQALKLAQAGTLEQQVALQKLGKEFDFLTPKNQAWIKEIARKTELGQFTTAVKDAGAALAAANAPTAAQALAFQQLKVSLASLAPDVQRQIELAAALEEQLSHTVPIANLREAVRTAGIDTERTRLEFERKGVERKSPELQPGEMAQPLPFHFFEREAALQIDNTPLEMLEAQLGSLKQVLGENAYAFNAFETAALSIKADEIARRIDLIRQKASELANQDAYKREGDALDRLSAHWKQLDQGVNEAAKRYADAQHKVAVADAERNLVNARRRGPAAVAQAQAAFNQISGQSTLDQAAAQVMAGRGVKEGTYAQAQANVELARTFFALDGDIAGLVNAYTELEAIQRLADFQKQTDALLAQEAATKKDAQTTEKLAEQLDLVNQQLSDVTGGTSLYSRELQNLEKDMGGFSESHRKMAEKVVGQKLKLDKIKEFADGFKSLFQGAFEGLSHGFGGFFKSIIDGFQQLLVRMAAEYLTSKIWDLFSKGIGLQKGVGGGGGGGAVGDFFGGLAGALFGGHKKSSDSAAVASADNQTGQLSNLLSSLPGLILGIPGLAGGGEASPGRVYQFEEQGPELFAPSVPGRVIPAHETAAALAGANGKGGDHYEVTVNVHGVNDAPAWRANKNAVTNDILTALIKSKQRNG